MSLLTNRQKDGQGEGYRSAHFWPEIAKVLAQLDSAGESVAAAELGDTTMLPHQFPLSRVDEIASVFGDEFARRVAQLEGGRWIGPIQSGYGWHIVYVSERTEGRPKPLSEVRDAVQRDWLAARRKEIIDATYSKMREKYAVIVEGLAPQADARSKSGRVANTVQRP